MQLLIGYGFVDRVDQADLLQSFEQKIRRVDFPWLDAHIAGAWHCMVVVVPAVADTDDGHEPVVHTVVFDVEVLVAPLWHVADDVQNQRTVERQPASQQTSARYDRPECSPENYAEKQTAEDIDCIA